MSKHEHHSIGTRTVRGMVWAYSSYVGGRLLVLVATAILARLLNPSDFGLVALALSIIALLEGISNFGLGQALVIQDDDVVHERAETVFVSSVALGFLLSLVMVAFSPLLASFFDEPELTPIAAVLGATTFLRSLGVTHYSLAQRGLDFRVRTIAEVAEVVLRGAVGIGLALAGFGAWSLVLGYLAGTLALDIAIWSLVPWRPKLRPSRADLGKLLRFGGTLSAVDVTAALIANVDYLFIGRALGPAALGLYTLGFRLPQLVIANMATVAGKVLFPAFSTLDARGFQRGFLVSVRYIWLITLPLATGIALLAEPLVLAVFGDQWEGAAIPMQIITIYSFAVTVGYPAGTAYKASGRAGVLLMLAVARLLAVTAALWIFVDQGIGAAAACQAAVAGAAAVVGILLASRLLKVRLTDIGRQIWPAVAATAIMAPVVFAISRLIESPWLTVLLGGAAGAAAYLFTLMVIAPDAIHYLRRKLRPAPNEPAPDPEPELTALTGEEAPPPPRP